MSGNVLISWNDPNIAELGYNIYRSTSPIDSNNLPVPIAQLPENSTSYLDIDNLQIGIDYYYRVGTVTPDEIILSDNIRVNIIEVRTRYDGVFDLSQPPANFNSQVEANGDKIVASFTKSKISEKTTLSSSANVESYGQHITPDLGKTVKRMWILSYDPASGKTLRVYAEKLSQPVDAQAFIKTKNNFRFEALWDGIITQGEGSWQFSDGMATSSFLTGPLSDDDGAWAFSNGVFTQGNGSRPTGKTFGVGNFNGTDGDANSIMTVGLPANDISAAFQGIVIFQYYEDSQQNGDVVENPDQGGSEDLGGDQYTVGAIYPHYYDEGEQRFVASTKVTDKQTSGQNDRLVFSNEALNLVLDSNDIGFGGSVVRQGLSKFVANGGGNGNYFGISDLDPITWDSYQKTNFPVAGVGGGINLGSLTFDGSRFIVCGEKGIIMTRTGTEDWAEIPQHNLQNQGILYGLCEQDGQYFVILKDNSGEYSIKKSTDLVNWSTHFNYTSTGAFVPRNLQFANKFLFILGDYPRSTNNALAPAFRYFDLDTGETDYFRIEIEESSIARSMNEIVFFKGQYIAYGTNFGCYSTNFKNQSWTTVEPNTNDVRRNLVHSDNVMLSLRFRGTNHTLEQTTDGVNWYVVR